MSVSNPGNIRHCQQFIPEESPKTIPKSIVVLGIDIGTSGIRASIVKKEVSSKNEDKSPTEPDKKKELLLFSASVMLDPPIINDSLKSSTQNPQLWIDGINQLLFNLSESFDLSCVTNLVLDATSSTVLLCNQLGEPLTEALMYNDQQATEEARLIRQACGFNPNSGATGASSSLAKILFLLKKLEGNKVITIQNRLSRSIRNEQTIYICNQIDFINFFLNGQLNTTDENNALKIGYDSINQAWPDWVRNILNHQNRHLELPNVVRPGADLGVLNANIIERYGFSESISLHAGTTDSIAGFLASGAHKIGDAVISLGSTLAIKVISDTPVFSNDFGVYSHRLKHNWLVGGASNSGGAVLTKAYSILEIKALINAIKTSKLTLPEAEQSAYYPLTKAGERFPIADSDLAPTMPIKPTKKINIQAPSIEHQRYFLSLIHGLIHIEQLAYEKLRALGCPPIRQIYAVGGGVQNTLWQSLRAECLPNSSYSTLTLRTPQSREASFGVTRLIEA